MGANYPLVSGTESPGSPSTLYVAQAAYASLPAGTVVGQKARATDVGLYGSDMSWNGTRWIPVNGSYVQYENALPLVKPPTINANASGTANGVTTLATAISPSITKGFFYCPANSISASHAAGFFYGEMQSTTAIAFYNNTYTPANGVYATEPTSKVAFSGAVPGAAGSTAAITAVITTLPAGILGASGSISNPILVYCNNTAGAKEIQCILGSSAVIYENIASNSSLSAVGRIKNHTASVQISSPRYNNYPSSTTPNNTNENTGSATSISVTLKTAAATDWMVLSEFLIRVEVIV